jgi:hypothetical protein
LGLHTELHSRWAARFVGHLWEVLGSSLGTLVQVPNNSPRDFVYLLGVAQRLFLCGSSFGCEQAHLLDLAPSNLCGLLGGLYSIRGGPFSVMFSHVAGMSPYLLLFHHRSWACFLYFHLSFVKHASPPEGLFLF